MVTSSSCTAPPSDSRRRYDAQRLLDGALLLLDFAANARQLGRGAVVERAVGQDLVAEVTQQGREVGDPLRHLAHRLPFPGNVGGGMDRDFPPLGGPVGDQQQIADLANLERGARDARLVDQCVGSSRP